MNPETCRFFDELTITDKEFSLFRELIYEKAGIAMAETKKGLVQGRLGKRLRHFKLRSFRAYYDLVSADREGSEMQMLVDLLTTNETYFFREQKHFDFIAETLVRGYKPAQGLKIWSAACSSGEEPYSIAMLLFDKLGEHAQWDILATDLNQQILDQAKRGVYPLEDAEKIPPDYLQAHCLKGTGDYANYFMLDKKIRSRVDFRQLNLNGTWDNTGIFDLIVLRNVMIYFDKDTRKRLVARMAERLKPGGYLFVGHSETLSGISDRFQCVQPAIYRLG